MRRATPLPGTGVHVALSPDGELAAVAVPGFTEIRDARSGQVRRRRPRAADEGPNRGSGSAFGAFSPDDRWAVELSSGGDVTLLDARTGRSWGELGGRTRQARRAFFPGDGTLVVLTGDGQSGADYEAATDASGYWTTVPGRASTWSLRTGERTATQRLAGLPRLVAAGGGALVSFEGPVLDACAAGEVGIRVAAFPRKKLFGDYVLAPTGR